MKICDRVGAHQLLFLAVSAVQLCPRVRYAGAITDLPYTGSGRRAIDRSVPFAQIVLENDIPYSMEAYNANMLEWSDFEQYLLKAVETKSSLKFIFTAAPEHIFQSALKKSNSDYRSYYQPFYYMTRYSRWSDKIGGYYIQYDNFYRQVRDAEIVKHELSDGGIVSVLYSNGVQVLINYAGDDKTAGGIAVGAKSFVVIN